jgi:hypothetical protein
LVDIRQFKFGVQRLLEGDMLRDAITGETSL